MLSFLRQMQEYGYKDQQCEIFSHRFFHIILYDCRLKLIFYTDTLILSN